ncbi:LysR family transcriptional regulator [Shewanella sp. AS1]|uniref:LysR family transcriptional regulator n=1 Tax=Shewanella sp. AS1 TaxID=2907626 RepID=UPI001F48799B|nr:LysR family transcriptional regulator [Shewanella sp. AS1]MCE9677873.1 LysR family transcriptional regulator [Shewanella sp. AS1]
MGNQNIKKLSELDVFCLMVFKAIFQTGHANIAAKQLNVSAPKISRCLNTLRATFDDELFYRRQLGLKPTPLAEFLFDPICQFCDSVAKIEQSLLEQPSEQHPQYIKVAVTSVMLSSLALAFSRSSKREQMGKVQFVAWDNDSADMIHNGELDFGVAFDASSEHPLVVSSLGSISEVCFAAAENHPIWLSSAITLETICGYHFLCLDGKGFNDKLDPLEVYARQIGREIENVSRVNTRMEWYSHLLTMDSVSFLPCSEAEIAQRLPGLSVAKLPAEQVALLHGECMSPQFLLIEAQQEYRRYSTEQRHLFIELMKSLF